MLSRSGRRRLTATVAALALTALAGLPAEHIHAQAADHDTDHQVLTHRHYESHHTPGGMATLDHQDDDRHVQWVGSFFTSREKSVVSRPPGLTVAVVAVTTPQPDVAWLLVSHAESVHDPPWASAPTLRGPPLFSA